MIITTTKKKKKKKKKKRGGGVAAEAGKQAVDASTDQVIRKHGSQIKKSVKKTYDYEKGRQAGGLDQVVNQRYGKALGHVVNPYDVNGLSEARIDHHDHQGNHEAAR